MMPNQYFRGAGKSPRLLAELSGATYYVTGKPCKRGHLVPRLTANGNCTECNRAACREHYRRARMQPSKPSAGLSRESPQSNRDSPWSPMISTRRDDLQMLGKLTARNRLATNHRS